MAVITVLHWILYTVVALLGWVGLVLVVGTALHGRTWVWARTALPKAIPPQRDQPIALMPRGGWL